VIAISKNISGAASHHQAVRILYRTRDNFKNIAKALGIMDDFKSGVPRMAYKGVVSTLYRGQRVYVAPNLNWKGYDPSWWSYDPGDADFLAMWPRFVGRNFEEIFFGIMKKNLLSSVQNNRVIFKLNKKLSNKNPFLS